MWRRKERGIFGFCNRMDSSSKVTQYSQRYYIKCHERKVPRRDYIFMCSSCYHLGLSTWKTVDTILLRLSICPEHSGTHEAYCCGLRCIERHSCNGIKSDSPHVSCFYFAIHIPTVADPYGVTPDCPFLISMIPFQ